MDDIRRERRIFENLFRRMEQELEDKVHETQVCNAAAEKCYKERDGAQNDMAELKVSAALWLAPRGCAMCKSAATCR